MLLSNDHIHHIIPPFNKELKELYASIAIRGFARALIGIFEPIYLYLFFDNSEVTVDEVVEEVIPLSVIACYTDGDCKAIGKIGICADPGEDSAECTYIEDVKVRMTIVNSEECFNC